MKILFVSSGNNKNNISPIIENQGHSLQSLGLEVDFFTIMGKGITGYLKNLPKVRTQVKTNNYDLIHAHYSLSAFVVTLTFPKIPIVVSIMGSDLMGASSLMQKQIYYFSNLFWSKTIVKSERMAKNLGNKNTVVIPNGVDISKFKPQDKLECQQLLNWDKNNFHLLFAANPGRQVKNFELFKSSFDLLKQKVSNIEYHVLNNVPNDKVTLFMNAADVVCLSSKWEGSPNVIKEAMACSRPVVCTDVGDVKWLFDDSTLKGHYISKSDTNDYSEKLKKAIMFSEKNDRTSGRNRIKSLNIDSISISKKIIDVYKGL